MLTANKQNQDMSMFMARRHTLCQKIKAAYPEQSNGLLVLFADFEKERMRFRQESSFYYLTGITEPAVAIIIDLATEQTTLYIPHYSTDRAQWMPSELIERIKQNPAYAGIDTIAYKGSTVNGYQMFPFFHSDEYKGLVKKLADAVDKKRALFTLYPNNTYAYFDQRFILLRLQQIIPELTNALVDISAEVASMRRVKNMYEIEALFGAIEVTAIAHEAAAEVIAQGRLESEVQAHIEYVMTASHGRPSFPSIVASGQNSTVLHYNQNNGIMTNGDVVVVDIGTELNYYCADITRTYPVSGTFTRRQKEVYSVVLETQEYIAEIAKPGYWLNNKEQPEQSLQHLAKAFLKKHNYENYFMHGIGHFLGLDVHDVGDSCVPLQEGDVFTIEPGIYIAAEALGIRIEDNYWMTENGAVCLSESLPKQPDHIEDLMERRNHQDDDSEDDLHI